MSYIEINVELTTVRIW